MKIITSKDSIVKRLGLNHALLLGACWLLAVSARADIYNWVGGGPDNSIWTGANWEGGIAPPVETGTSPGTNTVVFALSGTNAHKPSTGRFDRLVLNADSDFTLTGTGQSYAYLREGVYVGIPGTTPHTYTIYNNLYMTNLSNTIVVTNNGVPGGTTLLMKGQFLGVSGANASSLSFTGDGTVIMAATNGNGAFGRVYVNGVNLILRQESTNTGYFINGGLTVDNGTARLEGTGANVFYDSGGGSFVTNNGVLDFNGYTEKLRGLTLAGSGSDGNGALINSSSTPAVVLSSVAASAETVIGGSGDITIDGVVYTSPVGTNFFTKRGTNTLTLKGIANNTLLGFTVNEGKLVLNKDASYQGGYAIGGDLLVDGGIVELRDYSGQFNADAHITLTNSGVLDLNGMTETAAIVNLNGEGVGGSGAIINSSASPSIINTLVDVATSGSIGGSGDITISGPITGSGLFKKSGNNVLTHTGTNYGNTLIESGTFAMSGDAALGGSAVIAIKSGGTFDLTGLTTPPLLLGAGQTLSNSTSTTGTVKGSVDASAGIIAVSFASGTPALTIVDGVLTLAEGTTVNVNNTGAQLAVGSYKLVSAGSGGSVAGIAPTAVVVGGAGAAGAGALQINSGELYLVITESTPTPANIGFSVNTGGQVVLDWPVGQGWKLQSQTNGVTGTWYEVPGATPPWTIQVDPANPSVFYRLNY